MASCKFDLTDSCYLSLKAQLCCLAQSLLFLRFSQNFLDFACISLPLSDNCVPAIALANWSDRQKETWAISFVAESFADFLCTGCHVCLSQEEM